jgi:RNA polymerase sigma factor (sigma-70 family)
MRTVVHFIRRLGGETENLTDAQLLQRFIIRRDEAAFEALMRRHGPMVLGTCRRLLRQGADAEDAFQATFLVLAHKGASIGKRDSVASWLYGVAYRTALKAQAEAARRRAYEGPLTDAAVAPTVRDLAWEELRAVLDEEVNRLPQRYRAPVVLCYFEDKTYAEAACALGLAAGTVASRLARARDLLRRRLVRRGFSLSAGLLATLVSQEGLAAAVPTALLTSGLKGAGLVAAGQPLAGAIVSAQVVTLMKGVLKTMLLTKLKIVAALLLAAGVVGTGAGLLVYPVRAGQPAGEAGVEDSPGLRDQVQSLRNELREARQEIDRLKREARQAATAARQVVLYRGRPASFWIEQLKDGDPSYRAEAVKVLGIVSRNDRAAIAPLLASLKDQEEDVRLAATRSLGQAGAAAIPALTARLKEDGPMRSLAATALGDMGPEAKPAVPALIEVLKGKGAGARQAAATALARIGPAARAALPALVGALQAKDRHLWEAAVTAVEEIDPGSRIVFQANLPGRPLEVSLLREEQPSVQTLEKLVRELEKRYRDQKSP